MKTMRQLVEDLIRGVEEQAEIPSEIMLNAEDLRRLGDELDLPGPEHLIRYRGIVITCNNAVTAPTLISSRRL